MSKIIKAINAMISNSEKISQVTQARQGNELFFTYMDKHKWSMTYGPKSDVYSLHFYPGDIPIERLACVEGEEWEAIQMVTYPSNDLGGREAAASMRELYTILREKVHGVEDVLNEIIDDDMPS